MSHHRKWCHFLKQACAIAVAPSRQFWPQHLSSMSSIFRTIPVLGFVSPCFEGLNFRILFLRWLPVRGEHSQLRVEHSQRTGASSKDFLSRVPHTLGSQTSSPTCSAVSQHPEQHLEPAVEYGAIHTLQVGTARPCSHHRPG